MHHLKEGDILRLHEKIIEATGGAPGLRDIGALQTALAQPKLTSGGRDVHGDVFEKAAALGFTLVQSRPFAEGNKRIGHAAAVLFLQLNGQILKAKPKDAEQVLLETAAGARSRRELANWLRERCAPVERP